MQIWEILSLVQHGAQLALYWTIIQYFTLEQLARLCWDGQPCQTLKWPYGIFYFHQRMLCGDCFVLLLLLPHSRSTAACDEQHCWCGFAVESAEFLDVTEEYFHNGLLFYWVLSWCNSSEWTGKRFVATMKLVWSQVGIQYTDQNLNARGTHLFRLWDCLLNVTFLCY